MGPLVALTARIYGQRQLLLLWVVLSYPIEVVTPADAEHVPTHTVRWQDLAEFQDHPAHDQLVSYLAWKVSIPAADGNHGCGRHRLLRIHRVPSREGRTPDPSRLG